VLLIRATSCPAGGGGGVRLCGERYQPRATYFAGLFYTFDLRKNPRLNHKALRLS
jgi:hypothetical protein